MKFEIRHAANGITLRVEDQKRTPCFKNGTKNW